MKRIYQLFTLIVLISFTNFALACHCNSNFEGVKSLKELESYDYVALVKIVSENDHKTAAATAIRSVGVLHVEIIEQFKGKEVDEIDETSKNSSCDLGIQPGDQWILFAKFRSDKLTVGPCDRNVRYKDKDGVRDWHFSRGIRELDDLRRLYGHSQKQLPDGVNQEMYSNGQTEVEEMYSKGLRNGTRTIFYSNGAVYGKHTFVNDTLQGESLWYYPSGQVYHHQFFLHGKNVNISRVYYDSTVERSSKDFLIKQFYRTEDSLRFVFNRIQVRSEILYDHFGREILYREYSQLGKLRREELYQPEGSLQTFINYHDNGQVHYIGHFRNGKEYGHYQEYTREGKPSKSWDYDESGKQIRK